MKNVFFFLFFSVTIISCTNDENSSFEINGLYTYNIPNCDNGGNPEIHCTLFVDFVDKTEASPISITGGDIVYETTYTVNNDIIKFKKTSKFNFDLSFKIINDLTLKRIEDNTIWLKEE